MPRILLLADDSVTIQRVIELTFADEDIRVVAVGDGQQAVDRIKEVPPDIVLADTDMPVRNGYEVAAFIKEDPTLAHIPVVLLTGAFEPVGGERTEHPRYDAVLVKPFEPHLVVQLVRQLLGALVPSSSGIQGPESAKVIDHVSRRISDDSLSSPSPFTRSSAEDQEKPPELLAVSTEVPVAPLEPSGSAFEPPDPLGSYLDRMDKAFERLETGDTAPASKTNIGASAADATDSLEGAQGALEGASETLVFEEGDDDGTSAEIFDQVQEDSVSQDSRRGDAFPVTDVASSSILATPSQHPKDSLKESASSGEVSGLVDMGGDETSRSVVPEVPVVPLPTEVDVDDALVERVAERVLTRLSGGVASDLVAEVVARVAERLVREEIGRFKRS